MPNALLALVTLAALVPSAQAAPDLSTPRRALRAFIDAERAGDHRLAAQVLDLGRLDESRRVEQGPLLARQLKFVLDRTLWVDWDEVSDDPAGRPDDGPATDQVGAVAMPGGSVPVLLARGEREGRVEWRVAARTVAAIPALYERHGAGLAGRVLPEVFFRVRLLEMELWQWGGLALAAAVAAVAGLLLAAAGAALARRLARRTRARWDDGLVDALASPSRLVLALAVFAVARPALRLSVPAEAVFGQALRTATVAAVAWLALRLVSFAFAALEERLAGPGDGAARTRVRMMRRVAVVTVALLGTALVLVQFQVVRSVGTSLLASAGVAGLVVGLAAQRSISTLLAGLQLSITQPIRIGDTVIVESEWGQIEEITLTYVVVRIWDERRLVVPITRFLETPFQNWTKVSPQIMGTVTVRADYRVPVDAVRAELERFVRPHPDFDGRVCGLQVTDADDRTVTLRALVSSADAGRNWDLRCAVREALVKFLQQLDGGRYLPRVRLDRGEPPVADAVRPHAA